MSKCKRPNFPAFSLETVHEANKSCSEEGQRNAHDAEKMSQILPYVMLGSWRDAEDAERVMACGITHVLNVAKEVPPPVEQACMDAVKSVCKKQIALADAHSENILECFEDAFAFIDEARRSGGRVLVHCRRGISRSPAIVIGYIMYQTHSSYNAALTYVKQRRTSVSLNLAFQSLLEDYQAGSPRPDHELERLVLGCSKEEVSLRRPYHGRTPSSCSASDQCAGQTDCSDSCDSNYSGPVKPLPPSPDGFGKRTSSFLEDGFST